MCINLEEGNSILLKPVLDGKASGSDKPENTQFCKCCGDIVTQTNVFMRTDMDRVYSRVYRQFFSHKQATSQSENPKKKNNNIQRRPDSAVHHTGDDYVLGNLKFVPKGESIEVFGMAIPILIKQPLQQTRATPKKPTTTTPVKQSKPAPPPTKKPSKLEFETHQEKGEEEGDDADWNGGGEAIMLSLRSAFRPPKKGIAEPVRE
ncbi:hypothetical protein Tco_1547143 [Tanacetum coccineum]